MSLSLSALVASAIEEDEGGLPKKRKVAAGGEEAAVAQPVQQPPQQQVLVGAWGTEFVKTRLARDGPQAIPWVQQHHGLSTKYDKWSLRSLGVCLTCFVYQPT
jgi:hypothetical protein